MSWVFLEVCVDMFLGVFVVVENGVDWIELCVVLSEGGLMLFFGFM